MWMDLENTIVLSEISQTETDKYSTPALVCVCYPLSRGRLFWDPMDCSPPGSLAHRILQARILERVAISFSTIYVWNLKSKTNEYNKKETEQTSGYQWQKGIRERQDRSRG